MTTSNTGYIMDTKCEENNELPCRYMLTMNQNVLGAVIMKFCKNMLKLYL